MRRSLRQILFAVAGWVAVGSLGAGATPYEPVVISEYKVSVVPLEKAITVGDEEFSKRLVVVLRGANFHIRALDPVVKVGDREADDYRIFPGEDGMELTFYGARGLAEAETVSVAYPGGEPTVFPIEIGPEAIAQLREALR